MQRTGEKKNQKRNPFPQRTGPKTEGENETPISDKNPYVPHVYVKKRTAEY